MAGHWLRSTISRFVRHFLRQRVCGSEAFFATLKTEIGTTIWRTRAQARQDVFRYLRYYNHKRLHSTIGQNTPAETRTNYAQLPAA